MAGEAEKLPVTGCYLQLWSGASQTTLHRVFTCAILSQEY